MGTPMRLRRRGLLDLTPAALLVFVTGAAVPRAALFYHTHPGGDHVHTHGDEPEHAHDHSIDRHHAAHHHHHVATTCGNRLAFESPDGDAQGHWHSQSPFHPIAAVALATVLQPQRARTPLGPRLRVFFNAAVRPGRARSPPSSVAG
jgi:hypothetical protein